MSAVRRVIAERVREAVNECLGAAEKTWGVEVLRRSATVASLAHAGLDPSTLQALPQAAPDSHADTVILAFAGLVLHSNGNLVPMMCLSGPLHQLPGFAHSIIVHVNANPSWLRVGVSLVRARPGMLARPQGSLANNSEAVDRHPDPRPLPFHVIVNATPEEGRQALGLSLGTARVEGQQVVREGPGSVRLEVHPAWWVEAGDLVVRVLGVPASLVQPYQDATVGLCPIAKFEHLDERFKGVLAEALKVAAALQRCLVIQRWENGTGRRGHGKWLLSAHLTRQCQCSTLKQKVAH